MERPRVLIVEDNLTIATNLYDYLSGRGFAVCTIKDGAEAYDRLRASTFDIILLDLGLPGMDGIALCKKIREEAGIEIPILIITARDTLDDKLSGFQCGADDYLIKPFALEEVEARINVLCKRHVRQYADTFIQRGELRFNLENKKITYAGLDVDLPPKCVRIVELLMRNPGKLFCRQELEIELWGMKQDTSDRLRHHISILRRTFHQVSDRNIIKTIHGQGYSLSLQE